MASSDIAWTGEAYAVAFAVGDSIRVALVAPGGEVAQAGGAIVATSTGPARSVQIASDGTDLVVTWSEENRLRARRLSLHGQGLDEPRTIHTATSQYFSSLLNARDGAGYAITWTQPAPFDPEANHEREDLFIRLFDGEVLGDALFLGRCSTPGGIWRISAGALDDGWVSLAHCEDGTFGRFVAADATLAPATGWNHLDGTTAVGGRLASSGAILGTMRGSSGWEPTLRLYTPDGTPHASLRVTDDDGDPGRLATFDGTNFVGSTFRGGVRLTLASVDGVGYDDPVDGGALVTPSATGIASDRSGGIAILDAGSDGVRVYLVRRGDGVPDDADNCASRWNPEQSDVDLDGRGDACEDSDDDGKLDASDNCVRIANRDQADHDADGAGDFCDNDWNVDLDGVLTLEDNCPAIHNPDQGDVDLDGAGDACDDDIDGDAVGNWYDVCVSVWDPEQQDIDSDKMGDACDPDLENDGILNGADNCPEMSNPDQADRDADGVGDVCDSTNLVLRVPVPRGNTRLRDDPSPGCSVGATGGARPGAALLLLALAPLLRRRKP